MHKAVGMLNLRPVTAPAKDVKLAVGNQAEDFQRGLHRDDLVLPPVDDERGLGDAADAVLVARHLVHPALAGRREHGTEALLEAGADACLVAQLRQVVVDDGAVEGKGIQQGAHVFKRGGVAPGKVQTARDGEADAHGAHQHQPANPLRVADGERQCQGAAERIAHQVHLLQLHGIQEIHCLLHPGIHVVDHPGWAVGEAKARHVDGKGAAALR